MEHELKRKSVTAMGWSAAEAFSRQGLQFVISIFLARLLAPEEFGVVAMISLFTAVAGVFADGGFGSALIQKQEVSKTDASSVFYFNVAMGLIVALFLYICAPWIAAFYEMPVIQPLTRIMAFSVLISAFGSVHSALLTKELDFRTQMQISVVAGAISGGVAVALAWRGWGVWSLAVYALVSATISTSLLWLWRSWRPGLEFSLGALRSLFRFSAYLFLSDLSNTLFTRMYTLVIGKMYSAKDLGFFNRADSTRQMPAMLLATVVDRVAFPLFSSIATDKELLRRGMRKALVTMMLINVPVCLGLAAVSRPLVLTLYGEKWAPCVPYLQILSLSGTFWPLHVVNLNLLKSMGRSDLFFRVEVIKKVFGFSALMISAAVSILAMAWSNVLVSVISFLLNAYYTGRLLGYPATRQFRDVLPCFCAAGIMTACVWGLTFITALRPPALLAFQVLLGAIIYMVLCGFWKVSGYDEVVQQVKARVPWFKPSPAAQA